MTRPPRLFLVVTLAAGAALAGCPAPSTSSGEGEGEGEGEEGEGERPPADVDLVLDVTDVAPSVHFSFRRFADDDCDVTAGTVEQGGIRALMGFDLVMRNNGTRDFSVGATNVHLGDAACGGGHALLGFVTWKLVARDGTVVAGGPLDVQPGFSLAAAGGTAPIAFTASSLLDVTDVPPGDYGLVLTVDPDGVFDGDGSNNSITVPVVTVDMVCHDDVCGGACCPASNCVDDTCMMADLTVDTQVLADSVRVIDQFFGDNACDVQEACATPGSGRYLNFSTTTPNHGNADLVVGRPEANPFFHFSPCHQHYHFDQYANYRLLTQDGDVAATGHKQAFCLEDLEPVDQDAGNARFDCGNQGISVGWADTYGRHLDCQWIDVTGVPAGDYVLEVAVNPARVLGELDYTNDVVRVPVTLPDDPNICDPTTEICGNGRDESCDGVPDDGCAPLTDNATCKTAHTIDGSGLFQGEITADNAGDVSPSCGGAGGDLFFQFDVSTAGIVYMSTYGSDIDTTLSVFRGNACTDEALCVDDGCGDAAGGGHFLGVMEAGPYTAVVKAKEAGATGHVQFKLQQAGCSNAALLDVAQGEAHGDSTGLENVTAPSCVIPDGGDGPDQLWYFATCPGAHATSLRTCSPDTGFDTVLEVRDGACLGPTYQGACNDDLEPGQQLCSDVETTLQSDGAGDGLWFVLVDGYGAGDGGAYTLQSSVQ